MSIDLETGPAGVMSSEAARHFADQRLDIVDVDNDMRRVFLGDGASTSWNRESHESQLGSRYRHHTLDLRYREGIDSLVRSMPSELWLIVRTAAQPSHAVKPNDPAVPSRRRKAFRHGTHCHYDRRRTARMLCRQICGSIYSLTA